MSKLSILVTLRTAGGRMGAFALQAAGKSAEIWTSAGTDEIVLVRFEKALLGHIVDKFEIDGAAWRELESEGDLNEVLQDCQSGSKLQSALRAQLDVVENHYAHADCGTAWTDTHSCGCDDECPTCGAAIEASESVMLSGLSDDRPARYLTPGVAGQERAADAEGVPAQPLRDDLRRGAAP